MLASALVWCVMIIAYSRIAPSISELLYPLPNRALIDLEESVARKGIEERKTAECDVALESLTAKLVNVMTKGPSSNDEAWADIYRDIEKAYAPIAAKYARETD